MTRGTEKILVKETIREVDLIEFAAFLLKRMKWIVAAAFVGMLAAAFCAFVLVEPSYEATAQLYVPYSGDAALSLSQMQGAAYLAENYARVLQTWEVGEKVAGSLQLPYTPSELTDMLEVSVPDDTSVIMLTVSAGSAELAARIANGFAEEGSLYIAGMMTAQPPELLSAALVPQAPAGPGRLLIVLAGTAAAAAAAVWALFVVYSRDDRRWSRKGSSDGRSNRPPSAVSAAKRKRKRRQRGSGV